MLLLSFFLISFVINHTYPLVLIRELSSICSLFKDAVMDNYIISISSFFLDRDTVVGIGTGHGLGVPGIEYRRGRHFS